MTQRRKRKIVAGLLVLLFAMSLCFVPWFHVSGGPCIFGTSGLIPIWQLHTKVDFGRTTPPKLMTMEESWMISGESSGINFPILVLQWIAIGLVVYIFNRVLGRISKKKGALSAK